MIHYIITYPNKPGSYFDFDYYRQTHLPMGDELLGKFGLVSTTVEKGLPDASGNMPALTCVTRLYFEDRERMTAGFASHGARLRDDIQNYTNIQPVFTLAETL
jgi:uncharacterized protein (TIGR02118 family)